MLYCMYKLNHCLYELIQLYRNYCLYYINIACIKGNDCLITDPVERAHAEQLVKQFMLHKHSDHSKVNGCRDENGVCKKGFDHTTICTECKRGNKGFQQYKR